MNNENIPYEQQDLVYKLRKRAQIRRQIPSRKSVQEGQPDRMADLLEEAANEIESLLLFRENAFVAHPNIDLDIQCLCSK